MSQPVTYDRVYNFTEYQALNPSNPLPADKVDLELNTVKISLDQTQSNLALIQRDDGQIANRSVGFDQLKSELSVGVAPAVTWATSTNYQVNNSVFVGLLLYRCLISHISGVFATDLAAGKWLLVADFTPPAHTLTNDRLVQRAALSIMGNTSNATADVADIAGIADQLLRVNGAGTALAFGSLDLTKAAAVGSSILAVPNGGTGLAAGTSGGVPFFSATNAITSSALLTLRGVMVGGGAAGAPSTIAVGTNGQLLLGVTGAAPAFGTMSQDVAITNAGVATIQTNVVTNAKAAQMAAATLKGNPTASLANASDFTIQGLTNLAAPHATLDFIPIYDHVSGTIKSATPSSVGSAGSVSSFNSATGAINTSVVEQFFSATGTYTPTAGMKYCVIRCLGGGGAGGGCAGGVGNAASGGGGGAGSLSEIVVPAATIGASKAVTIGAGGTVGTAGANAGNAGGDTSVGTICVGKGGSGGGGGNAGAAAGTTGAGGIAGTGTIAGTGAAGAPGFNATITTVAIAGAGGGSSIYGSGGAGRTTNGAGSNASGFGAGGGAGLELNNTVNVAGGTGSPGMVYIIEFVQS
jgi:hypothetical protein